MGAELSTSAKDRAENVMIVDLLRNDLSRVCQPGTVDVPELCALERYATVQHLVSSVVGRLAPGRDGSTCWRRIPGGSITAPKAGHETIAEIEPVAYQSYRPLSVSGAMDTSIAIRPASQTAGRTSGRWRHRPDSAPEREYAESSTRPGA
jgi:para-aminobenzoate synthetase component 1